MVPDPILVLKAPLEQSMAKGNEKNIAAIRNSTPSSWDSIVELLPPTIWISGA